MTFDKWFSDYAPGAPECLDDCAKAAWHAGADAEREACALLAEGFEQNRDWVPGSLYGNLRAEMAAVIRQRAGAGSRYELQRTASHPAPCAKFCESVAFKIEIRRLKILLSEAFQHVAASAEASHLTDGFKKKPENQIDRLANRIKSEIYTDEN